MSIFRDSGVGDFTRGGQTTIHFIRMIFQVFKQFFKACLFIWLVVASIAFYLNSEPVERYLGFKWGESWVFVEGMKDTDYVMNINTGQGGDRRVRATSILHNKEVIGNVNNLYYKAIYALVLGLMGMFVAAWILLRFIHRTGKDQGAEEYVRGGKLVEINELKKITKNDPSLCDLNLCGVRMPKGADVAHIMLMGSPGTGKSVNYKELLTGIRKAKKRAIVYDVGGDFISSFYREGKDIILNPLDARGRRWDVWCECSESSDYIQLSESFIPDAPKADPFWTKSARIVFSSLCEKIGKTESPTTEKLMNALLRISIADLMVMVQGTDARSMMSEGAEKMAANIRGIIGSYAQSLRFLHDQGERFSIRDWVSKDDDDSWVFISCKADQRALMRPLISAWLDTASNALLSLQPDRERRIFLLIDELPSLNRLPSLDEFLAESRKYGGCGIIGVQNYSQLIRNYSKEGADSIAGLCSTWVVFRCNDEAAGATWASKNLGSTEALETSEGISYGSNEIRDGVNLSRQKRLRPIVLPSEISNLPDLHGYIRFGRGLPLARFVSKIRNYKVVAEGFIPKVLAASSSLNEDESNEDHSTEFTERREPYISESPVMESKDEYSFRQDEPFSYGDEQTDQDNISEPSIADDIGADIG
ncbi:type IV conjugative transfer system coupling protein TraD [Endozoicomonas sp. ONNA1]|uniref:type IV conjugative transfer system coupling protein TraD n=1 Tax=Endozoicomonas sp. ONNA1 TaxID=2828740 RepID=UPI00214965A5|nr:type IV conjugative transfer system coupling protein TraD [Endozoicomonas sp. ONNA1]